MLQPRYAAVIIVYTLRYGVPCWFISDKERWVLDQVKWSNSFAQVADDDPDVFEATFGIPRVDELSIDVYLGHMIQYSCTTADIRAMLLTISPPHDYKSVAHLIPALYVDFDAHELISLYPEPLWFERYIPDGWTGRYDDFLDLIPHDMRYWVVDGIDLFATLR